MYRKIAHFQVTNIHFPHRHVMENLCKRFATQRWENLWHEHMSMAHSCCAKCMWTLFFFCLRRLSVILEIPQKSFCARRVVLVSTCKKKLINLKILSFFFFFFLLPSDGLKANDIKYDILVARQIYKLRHNFC